MPITALPESFNTIYLFNAERSSPTGTVVWRTAIPTPVELETVRSRGQRVILSVGGSGNGIDFESRAVSRRLVSSVVAINAQLGGTRTAPGIDGVDFNTFEAENVPRVSEYLWMFAELKRIFGSSFLVTSPPAPWKRSDQRLVRSALARELMDYAAPQYYGGAGLNAPEYILESVRTWVEDVADGEAGRVVVGFGMADRPHFSGLEEITEAWEAVESSLPGIRGAYLWHHRTDAAQGWVYARTLNPRVAGQFDPRS